MEQQNKVMYYTCISCILLKRCLSCSRLPALFKAFLEGVDKQLDTLRGVLMTRLDGFLSSLSESVHVCEGESSLYMQQDFVRNEEDRSRLGVVRAGIEQLLQENDPFQFIKVRLESICCHKNHHFRLME